MGATYIEDLVR